MNAPIPATATATAAPVEVDTRPDPGLVFLARAVARLALVEAGEMDLDEAVYGLIDAYDLDSPTFVEACRRVDAKAKRKPGPEVLRARRLLDDSMTLDRAWWEINRRGRR